MEHNKTQILQQGTGDRSSYKPAYKDMRAKSIALSCIFVDGIFGWVYDTRLHHEK